MAASVEDFLNSDSSNWIKVLSLYSNVLERKAEKKSKPLQRQELIELDEWYGDIVLMNPIYWFVNGGGVDSVYF